MLEFKEGKPVYITTIAWRRPGKDLDYYHRITNEHPIELLFNNGEMEEHYIMFYKRIPEDEWDDIPKIKICDNGGWI